MIWHDKNYKLESRTDINSWCQLSALDATHTFLSVPKNYCGSLFSPTSGWPKCLKQCPDRLSGSTFITLLAVSFCLFKWSRLLCGCWWYCVRVLLHWCFCNAISVSCQRQREREREGERVIQRGRKVKREAGVERGSEWHPLLIYSLWTQKYAPSMLSKHIHNVRDTQAFTLRLK